MKTKILFIIIATFFTNIYSQSVPEWAKSAVWYQIFPERFRNGDTKNDPTPEEIVGKNSTRKWRISLWTSDWYELQPWEKEHSKNFYDNVFDRRYGGDLQGVIDKLDYLSELGITAIYFNPIFEAYSLHKYDASLYHHIDNNFGPDPVGDVTIIQTEKADTNNWVWTGADKLFLQLVSEAHKRGIKIIIDGVFNHIGTDFWAFRDIVKNKQNSKYLNWFIVKKWDDPNTPQDEFDYQCWWGVKSLPEFNEDSLGLVKGPREYVFNITKRWMDPNGDGNPIDGVDGWRLDVANEVAFPFWREWRKLVKSINPSAYIVGEIWNEATVWLKGDMFDAVMNYPFAYATLNFFINNKISVSKFDSELKRIRENYPSETNYVLQNLLDSHDTDRLSSMILNSGRDFDQKNSPRNNENYIVDKPNEKHKKIQKLVTIFQMCYVGAPMIYYGDEAGMWGADDPDDRKPMLWKDLKYDDEKSHPLSNKTRNVDKNVFDDDMFGHYKKIISIRKQNPALSFGDYQTILTNDSKGIYIFKRTYKENSVIVIMNNNDKKQKVTIQTDGKSYNDVLNNKKYQSKSGKLELEVDEKWAMIIINL